LFVHGDQDPDVPAYMSERLYQAAPEPKQLWLAPGADHNNISQVAGDAYGQVIEAFCTSHQLQSV
ncbi:MAG: alpha/beta hydrolase, partial [Cyanobacteria bacterium J06555_13]